MGRAERRKEERNINHAKSTGADACSILTFVEDGRMFYKLLDHRDRYPESTPDLMLTILPFCALAAHDSVRFVKKYFDHDFELDSAVVNRLRNASKSLSAKGSTVEDYTFMTNSVTRGLSSSTKKATGLFGPLINSLTPDMGICTHGDRPVCTTFITARYISQAYGGALDPVWSEECEKQLGFDLGVAASAAFYTVKLLTPELHTLTAKEFETCHVDCHYSDMLLPLKKQGIDVVFRQNDSGRIYGVTFIDHDSRVVLNGSRLGKEYSANVFNERFSGETGKIHQPEVAAPQQDQPTHQEQQGFTPKADIVSGVASVLGAFGGLLGGGASGGDEPQDNARQKRKKKKKRTRRID